MRDKARTHLCICVRGPAGGQSIVLEQVVSLVGFTDILYYAMGFERIGRCACSRMRPSDPQRSWRCSGRWCAVPDRRILMRASAVQAKYAVLEILQEAEKNSENFKFCKKQFCK